VAHRTNSSGGQPHAGRLRCNKVGSLFTPASKCDAIILCSA
jgi:hypothetical protein